MSAKTPPLFLFLSRWVLMRTGTKSRRTGYYSRFVGKSPKAYFQSSRLLGGFQPDFCGQIVYAKTGTLMAWRATMRAGLRLWVVLSMIATALALAPSSCSPIEPGAGQLLQAPTSGESAVQCAALTAKQNSSECARVDPAASRWLLVHVTFDSTLGFPERARRRKGRSVRSLSRTAH